MIHRSLPYIIDIEASGFGPESYPIEVGIVLGAEKRFCSLIKPVSGWDFWSEEAEAQHGITRETVETHGKDVAVVAKTLNELLYGKTVYSDGWVVDSPWIKRLFAAAKVSMQFRISSLEILLSEEQISLWDDAKEKVQQTLSIERHRASNDALIIQQTYLLTKELVQASEPTL